MEYNKQQQAIIDNLKGAFLVAAPVGTGKTSVLTARILAALRQGIGPEEILSLTFTNRSAEEMSRRIRSAISDKSVFEHLLVKTFHGFCAYLVRAEAKTLGINADFSILDEAEQKEALSRALAAYPEIRLDEKQSSLLELSEQLYRRRLIRLRTRIGHRDLRLPDNELLDRLGRSYLEALSEQNALDFNELVIKTIEALHLDEAVRAKWLTRFRLIQLDEFQDMHISEYLVVKELAKAHGNIALIGDLDQTIYSWRGSEPHNIAKLFSAHFAPVRTFGLEINYRFNPFLLAVVKSFLGALENPQTKSLASGLPASGSQECVTVFGGVNFAEEAGWVIENIRQIRAREPQAKVAVLARANYQIGEAAEIFARQGVAHITVDKYDFFRRQEVKDIMACLKIIFNKFDLDSAYRLVQRPARGIGAKTLSEIRQAGDSCQLKISDFLDFRNFNYPEPFARLRQAWKGGRIIVLDTETTGTNPLEDEIVQVYALEIINGRPGKDFARYIRNARPVGASEAVHQLSDEFLRENGGEARAVLEGLKQFIGSDPVGGHNVNFDLSMIRENGKRQGVLFDFAEYYDTLDLSKRLLEAENYKLSTLARQLGLSGATHDARDDVAATAGLLGQLVARLEAGAPERAALFRRFSARFIRLSAQIKNWEKTAHSLRPAQALMEIWEDSGLREFYDQDPASLRRRESIATLSRVFAERDQTDEPPDRALRGLIHYAALVRDINFLGLEKGQVPIVTVHQVKGLEFDRVFIIGLNDRKFPIPGGDQEEEKRLFYVALTRARQAVYLSYSHQDRYGRPQAQSPFIGYIDSRYIV